MPFEQPERAVDRVFLHCSASDRLEHDDIEVIRDWHVNGNGWSDVGYHFFIRKDGTVEDGSPAAPGPYFVQVTTGEHKAVGKLLLSR